MFQTPSENLYSKFIKDKKVQKEIDSIFEKMTDEEFYKALEEAGFEFED